MDVPDVALEMMRELIYGKSDRRFHSYQQNIDRAGIDDSPDSCPLCPEPSSSYSCQDDDSNGGGTEDGTTNGNDNNKTSKADDLSGTVMNRERIWIGILLTIIALMSCWIVVGGRNANRRDRYKGFGSDGGSSSNGGRITAHKSEMVELTVSNGNGGGYSDYD